MFGYGCLSLSYPFPASTYNSRIKNEQEKKFVNVNVTNLERGLVCGLMRTPQRLICYMLVPYSTLYFYRCRSSCPAS